MARKKASGWAKKSSTAKAIKPPDVKFTEQPTLLSLLRKARSTRKTTQSAAGEFGQAIANAVEHKHLHRKAFNIVKGLDAVEDDAKLAETLLHLDHYIAESGLRERAAKAPRLPMDDGPKSSEKANGKDDDKPGLRVVAGTEGQGTSAQA